MSGEWVDPTLWRDVAREARARGFDYLDLLTAVDRPEQGTIEVVLVLMSPSDATLMTLNTSCARQEPSLDSLTPVFPSASWHEREIAEMFGVTFTGHPDPRPLLLARGSSPLRKDAVFPPRHPGEQA